MKENPGSEPSFGTKAGLLAWKQRGDRETAFQEFKAYLNAPLNTTPNSLGAY